MRILPSILSKIRLVSSLLDVGSARHGLSDTFRRHHKLGSVLPYPLVTKSSSVTAYPISYWRLTHYAHMLIGYYTALCLLPTLLAPYSSHAPAVVSSCGITTGITICGAIPAKHHIYFHLIYDHRLYLLARIPRTMDIPFVDSTPVTYVTAPSSVQFTNALCLYMSL